MNIVLIGFMGSGKTSVGRKLAEKLQYEYVDMDPLIEQKVGMTVGEIFRKKGEKKFRKLEKEILEKLVQQKNIVVSTGGGVPCQPGNMKLINKNCISIYLQMDAIALFERLKPRQARRPLIRDLSEKELKQFINTTLAKREKYYLKAKFIVDGSKRNENEILRLLEA